MAEAMVSPLTSRVQGSGKRTWRFSRFHYGVIVHCDGEGARKRNDTDNFLVTVRYP
jgi:hypothetical protein